MLLDFYNETANQAYPFILDPVLDSGTLAKGGLLDAGFWVGPAAAGATVPGIVDIRLVSITLNSGVYTIVFGSLALPALTYTFTRTAADPDGKLTYADAAVNGDTDPQAGTAFLVTGDMSMLSTGSVVVSGTVEPSCVQVNCLGYVASVNLANDPDPAFGSQSGLPDPAALTVVAPRGKLLGDVLFIPGYNSVIQLAAASNKLTFGAEVGAGAGEPCDYVWRDSSSSSSLGCACSNLFYTINSQGPDDAHDFKLYGGTGITIIPDPDNHRVRVLIDYQAVLQGCLVT